MTNLKQLSNQLLEQVKQEDSEVNFTAELISGDVDVLKITVEDREELPIFISISENQILCISYLFKIEEVKDESVNELNHSMISANISMPLSSFSLIDNQYVIYGALSINSSIKDIIHEIEILSSNTIDAIESISDYLK